MLATAKKTKTAAKSGAKSGAKPPAKATVKATVKVAVKSAAKAVVKKVKGKVATVAKAEPKAKQKVAAKATLKVVTKVAPKASPIVTAKVSPKATLKVAVKTAPAAAAQSPKAPSKLAPFVAAVKEEMKVVKAPMKPEIPATKPSKLPKGTLLTEAELVKQPKSEYMSKDQLEFFRHRLMVLQAELRENAGATTEHLRELAVAPDPADRATLEEEHALELRARDRERKLLKKVEGALLRIDSGEYGYCDETGEPIGVPRLLARPTATLTIEAQERREMKQKMYGE